MCIRDRLEADGYKVLITHYADLLKYICRQFFGWDGQKDDAGRRTLQYVGTDIIRAKKPDFWVDFIASMIELFPNNWDYILIPDCRFPNEIERLKSTSADTVHLRVVRDNFKSPLSAEQQQHPSEVALDGVEPDYYIKNSGSLKDLRETIIQWSVSYTHLKLPKALCFNCFRTHILIEEPFMEQAYAESKRWLSDKVRQITRETDFRPDAEYFKCTHLCEMNEFCEYYRLSQKR